MEKIILGERIRSIRKGKSLTQQAFAGLLGASTGFISEVEQGKKLPGSEFLSSLLRIFGVSLNWLFTGEGEMFVNQQGGAGIVAEAPAPYGNLTPEERKIIGLLRENPELEGLCLKLLGGRQSVKEALEEFLKLPDPGPLPTKL